MRLLRLAGVACLLGSCLLAESWSGTLMDVMCKDKDLAGHTKECAVNCAKRGFGIVLSDGKFVKLDEAGNTKALAALKGTKKEKDLKATIKGMLDGGVIRVDSIAIQ